MGALYPLFLRLAGKDVLVVGAGAVAERKIDELVAAGAKVRVVAPEATPRVQALSRDGFVRLSAREFEPGDADGAWLVIASTSRAEVQREVSSAAEARGVFAVAVDDPPNGSAYGAAVLRRAPLTVAISSDGEAPALVRLLREILEQVLPERDWVDAARALRAKWRAEATPIGARFGELVRAYKERASTS
jgi:uroporphyrin-III C-methyltransferase/precorrin-2 dehydrogenase/sirohydrochlorin ferrochelatase